LHLLKKRKQCSISSSYRSCYSFYKHETGTWVHEWTSNNFKSLLQLVYSIPGGSWVWNRGNRTLGEECSKHRLEVWRCKVGELRVVIGNVR
jgi:hypothetical protein